MDGRGHVPLLLFLLDACIVYACTTRRLYLSVVPAQRYASARVRKILANGQIHVKEYQDFRAEEELCGSWADLADN